MKKIINNKLYDTSTAHELASREENPGDSHYVNEVLYRKRTGEYFLFGEGGPSSRYAEQVDYSHWSGGSTILPLTYKDAVDWAERHLDADEYQSLFGPVSEDEEDGARTTLGISLTGAEAAAIRQNAAKAGLTLSAYIVSKCK